MTDPIPLAAPVITITLPLKSKAIDLLTMAYAVIVEPGTRGLIKDLNSSNSYSALSLINLVEMSEPRHFTRNCTVCI